MNKTILIGVDGCRPDLVRKDLMPNLAAMVDRGVWFDHHRSVFPSETYVNTVSIMTGVPPGDHGIVANSFFDSRINHCEPWIGSRVDMTEAGIAAYGAEFVSAPTLGERLARRGKRLWVFNGNSPGSARLMHPHVTEYPGHLLVVGQDVNASLPQSQVSKCVKKVGYPPHRKSDRDMIPIQRFLTDAFLYLAAEEGLPDASVLWYGEPDHSSHSFGLGAELTIEALRSIDIEIGRLLDWWCTHRERNRIQVIVTSDHGHVTQTKRVDTAALLADAGFRVSRCLDDEAELFLVPGYTGSIYAHGGDKGLVEAAVHALMAHPDMGMLFTNDRGIVPGTFAHSTISVAHDRVANIVFTLRADDKVDPFGFQGTCCFDNELPLGAGIHGGLHPSEMSALLVMTGSVFAEGRKITAPSSTIDLLPTLLSLLDENDGKLPGRVLSEARIDTDSSSVETEKVRLFAADQSYKQELQFTKVGEHVYLDHGYRR